jgi:NADH:ubiquinone oxidoreductase subunit E
LTATSSEELKEKIREAIASQKRPTVTVLSSLLAIQDNLGYIPDEAIEEVAAAQNTSINHVYGVASFYPNFRFTPPESNFVEVCWGPTCHLQGAQEILHRVLGELGLEDEGDAADKHVTFKFNTCLGACAQAPVISVNHRLMGRMTPEAAVKAVSDPGSGGGSH